MPGSFLDTSALAKHYHVEIGSAEVDRQWSDSGRDLFVSRIGVVEAISVFAGKVRTGELAASAFTVLQKRFLSDVGGGRPKLVRLLVRHFKEADRLIGQYGLTRSLKGQSEHPPRKPTGRRARQPQHLAVERKPTTLFCGSKMLDTI